MNDIEDLLRDHYDYDATNVTSQLDNVTSRNVTGYKRETMFDIESKLAAEIDSAGKLVYAALGVTGLFANLFVIAVILIWERNRSNRSVTQLFALNLAFADLLFVFITPLYFVNNWHEFWGGYPLCFANKVFHVINYHASIMFLTVMSLDRLLATVFLMRMRVHRTRNTATWCCVVVWAVAVATAYPWMATVSVEKFNDGSSHCSHKWPKSFGILFDEIDTYGKDFTDREQDLLHEFINSNRDVDYELYDLEEEIKVEDDLEIKEELIEKEKSIIEGIIKKVEEKQPYTTDKNNKEVKMWWQKDEEVAKLHENKTEKFTVHDDYDDSEEYANTYSCTTENQHSMFYRNTLRLRFIFLFVFPVLIIAGSYLAILFKATKSLNRMQSAQRNMRKHMVVTILTMVVAFIFCWTPTLVFGMVKTFTDLKVSVHSCWWMQETFDWIAYSNCAINPILYWLASRSFQQKIRAVHEYVTTGRNLRSLVIRHHTRDESTNRTSLLRFQPSANRNPTNANKNEDTLPLKPLSSNKKASNKKDETFKNSVKKNKETDIESQRTALIGSNENE